MQVTIIIQGRVYRKEGSGEGQMGRERLGWGNGEG